MKVIPPVTISDAMYTSGPAEADYAAYAAGTTYSVGDHVIRTSTHRIYESLQSGNTGHTPETSSTWWLDIAPTNKWACMDNLVGTATVLASPLAIVIAPGAANSIALLELVGTSVTIGMTSGGSSVYSATVNLDDSSVSDYYDYFFAPFVQRSGVVLTDLPPYANGIITVTLTGGGTVELGVLKVGLFSDLGATLGAPSAGINDYSVKTTDAFGNTTLTQRAYSNRITARLLLPKADFNRVHRKLADLRATACVWVATADADLYPLTSYGFYKDFQLEATHPYHALCSLEIEGMT